MSSNNRDDEAKITAAEEKMKEHEERGNVAPKEENKKDGNEDDEQTNAQYKHNIFRKRNRRTRRMRSLTWPPCMPTQQMLASTYTTVDNKSESSDETPPGEFSLFSSPLGVSVSCALFINKYLIHMMCSSSFLLVLNGHQVNVTPIRVLLSMSLSTKSLKTRR